MNRRRYPTGITLIELLIAMLLFAAVAGSASWVFVTGVKTWNSGKGRSTIRQGGDLAMEAMVRYLGLAGNITAATANSITFAADTDNNGADETVTIAFDAVNKRINITSGGVTRISAPYVQGLNFSYFQANTEVAFTPVIQEDRDTVRLINVSLTMNNADDTITLNSSAYCRNQGVV